MVLSAQLHNPCLLHTRTFAITRTMMCGYNATAAMNDQQHSDCNDTRTSALLGRRTGPTGQEHNRRITRDIWLFNVLVKFSLCGWPCGLLQPLHTHCWRTAAAASPVLYELRILSIRSRPPCGEANLRCCRVRFREHTHSFTLAKTSCHCATVMLA